MESPNQDPQRKVERGWPESTRKTEKGCLSRDPVIKEKPWSKVSQAAQKILISEGINAKSVFEQILNLLECSDSTCHTGCYMGLKNIMRVRCLELK
jgi:hypothetical protein